MVGGMKIAQGDPVAVVRGAAEGEIRQRHRTQAANVDVSECGMQLEMLHQSVDAGQRHLTLVKRRKWVGRWCRLVMPSHGECGDRPAHEWRSPRTLYSCAGYGWLVE